MCLLVPTESPVSARLHATEPKKNTEKAPYVQEFEGFGANANLHPVLTDLKNLRDLHVERLNS
jgi:hypothetical protein